MSVPLDGIYTLTAKGPACVHCGKSVMRAMIYVELRRQVEAGTISKKRMADLTDIFCTGHLG